MNINDLPFQPEYDESGMTAVKEWLVDNVGSFSAASNFCVSNNDGSELTGYLSRACHGALLYTPCADRSLIGTEIATIRKGLEEVIDPWLKWLLYDSYYGRFILNRDDYDFCKKYGIILSCDMPAPLMQNINIISRAPTEACLDAFVTFGKLVEQGYDPALVYMFVFCSSISKHSVSSYDKTVVSCRMANHVPYRLCSQAKGLKAYVTGDFGPSLDEHAKSRIYRYETNYNGGAAYFPGHWFDGTALSSPTLKEALSSHRKEKKGLKAYTPPNPFAPPSRSVPRESGYPTITEFIEVILPLLQKEIETT